MGLRRTAFAAAMISLALLSGCTTASHPTALGSAAPDSAVAVAIPVSSSAPVSVPANPPPSTLASSASASIAGTPTSAAVVSPTAYPTTSPTALSSNDIAAGVRATAQAFFTDLNIAFATGNVTPIETLTAPACGCRSLVNTIRDTYAQHQRIVGVVANLTSLQVVSFVAAGATADMHYSITAGRILDVNGNQVNTSVYNPDEHSAMFVLGVDNQWVVEQNTLLDTPTR